MKSNLISLGTIVFAILLVGCGIPQEEYDAKLNELTRAQAELKEMTSAKEQVDDQLNKNTQLLTACEEESKNCKAEKSVLTERLSRSGQDLSALESELQEAKEQLEIVERARLASERQMREFKQLLERFQQLIDAGKLQVKIVDGRIIVQIPNSILFPPGKFALNDEGKDSILQITNVLKTIPDRQYQVTGHTDNDPVKATASSPYKNNWELSCYRALSVVEVMLETEIEPKRISAAGYGEFSPVAPNDTPENKAFNRRTEIVLMPDVSDLPSLEQLNQKDENQPEQ